MLLDAPGISVHSERCPTTEITAAVEIRGLDCFELCLVRAGCFSYRDGRGRVLVDPTSCVFAEPDQTADIAHPVPGGDLDTLIFVSPHVLDSIRGSNHIPLVAHVTSGMQVAHRRLLAAGRAGSDPMQIEELTIFTSRRR